MNFQTIFRNISRDYLLVALFIVIGGIMELFYQSIDFLSFAVNIYYIFLCIVFAGYVLRHVVVKKQRICVFLSAVMMIFLVMLRMMKYKLLIESSDASRYLWYIYYIPFICIPLFLLYTALMMGESRPHLSSGIIIITASISLALIFAIITNDYHQLVFRFKDLSDYDNYERSYVYYAVFAWILILFLSAYIVLIHRCHILMGKKYSWLTFAFSTVGWGITALFTFTYDFQHLIFNGSTLIQLMELYCAQSALFVLTCIRLWFIPADKDYNRLNDEIAEVNKLLEEESELTRLQNELEREQVETEQKNRLYDEIAECVADESEHILKLTQQNDTLPVVCVYGAYIKRIANFMLMASEQPNVSLGELVVSIREIMRYLGKTKIFVSLQGNTDGIIPTLDAVEILRTLNCIVCENLSGLSGVIVTFSENQSSFLKVAVEGVIHSDIITDVGKSIVCSSSVEDNITYITFGFAKGGEGI